MPSTVAKPKKTTLRPCGGMVVYHGGTEVVAKPEIRTRLRMPDFGTGFYTTSSEEQAVRWAKHVRLIRGESSAVVTSYDVSGFHAGELVVKKFESVTEEWFDAVIACRGGNDVFTGFDVVIGPVANDNVYQTIRFFETGVYSKDEAMRRLLAERLFNQVSFKTAASLDCLKYISHAVVEDAGGAE